MVARSAADSRDGGVLRASRRVVDRGAVHDEGPGTAGIDDGNPVVCLFLAVCLHAGSVGMGRRSIWRQVGVRGWICVLVGGIGADRFRARRAEPHRGAPGARRGTVRGISGERERGLSQLPRP